MRKRDKIFWWMLEELRETRLAWGVIAVFVVAGFIPGFTKIDQTFMSTLWLALWTGRHA